jgi:hypothetical protein
LTAAAARQWRWWPLRRTGHDKELDDPGIESLRNLVENSNRPNRLGFAQSGQCGS